MFRLYIQVADDTTRYSFLDEPTRGIDVGAKYEIYTIIEEMAANGKAVCLLDVNIRRIIGMCDRIYTMNEGRITNVS
ncbi:hypothetical protein EfmAA242_13260 [Enterococcus faecium]|nr:hypothetical protein EfmAA242_13260 [Enterococcus faecium]